MRRASLTASCQLHALHTHAMKMQILKLFGAIKVDITNSTSDRETAVLLKTSILVI